MDPNTKPENTHFGGADPANSSENKESSESYSESDISSTESSGSIVECKTKIDPESVFNLSEAYVIAVFGGTNSGKTTLFQIISDTFGKQLMIIPQDSFYMTGDKNTNFDHPNSIELDLLVDCVKRAKRGENIEIPVYDFATHSRSAKTKKLRAKPIVVVEGILIMSNPELASLCDLKIYVHAELDTMYRRRSVRDKKERGRTQEQIDAQWDRDVKPMHLRYVHPSSREADIIINNDRAQILTEPHKIPQINIMLMYIDSYLKECSKDV